MGPTTTDPAPSVTPGMRVVDATGRPVGRVHAVRAGDPNAVTVQGGGGPPDPVGPRIPHPEAGDEPEVAPDLAARLLRAGYVEVRTDGPAGAGYVEPVQVAEVRGDVVTLAVAWSEVTHRRGDPSSGSPRTTGRPDSA